METLETFLTAKQLNFCNEYLIDMNATRAAIRAGYSVSTAMNGRLMTMPKIKAYLDGVLAQRAAEQCVTRDMVLKELAKIAFGSMGDYFNDSGQIKPVHELSDDAKCALWSVSVSDGGSGGSAEVITKFRLYNKLTALDKIAKHLDMYNPKYQEPVRHIVYMDKDTINKDDLFEDEAMERVFEKDEEVAVAVAAVEEEAAVAVEDVVVEEEIVERVEEEVVNVPVVSSAGSDDEAFLRRYWEEQKKIREQRPVMNPNPEFWRKRPGLAEVMGYR